MTQDDPADSSAPPGVTADGGGELPSAASPPPGGTLSVRRAPSFAIGFAGGLVGGVGVLALAAGGLIAGWPLLHDVVSAPETSRLAVLEHSVDDVASRLGAIEHEQSRSTTAESTASIASLAQRVAALEGQSRTSSGDPRINALAEQTERLAADVAKLKSDTEAMRRAIPPEGTILRLAERAESAETVARRISSQHASAQALLLVVGQLRDAVDRGDPYPAELQAARRVAGPEDARALDALAPGAAAGVPRKEDLFASFPSLTSKIVRAAYVPPGTDIWHRALAKAASLISVRRVDGAGDGTAAIVARAEAQVKAGDLAKAVGELAALQGQPADVAAPWIAAATSRVTADRALSELVASIAAETAKAGE
jgi:hypothetical protein